MQDTMTDISVFAYAGLVAGNVGLEKIFCYTIFLFQKIEIKYWLLFSQIIVPLCSNITKGRNGDRSKFENSSRRYFEKFH